MRVLYCLELLTLYLHFVALYILLTKEGSEMPTNAVMFGWAFFYIGVVLCIPFSKWTYGKAKEKDEHNLKRDWEVYEAMHG